MATNPAVKRSRYCPVEFAPPPETLPERAPTSYETPQLSTLRYRGAYIPGKESTYATTERTIADRRLKAGNV